MSMNFKLLVFVFNLTLTAVIFIYNLKRYQKYIVASLNNKSIWNPNYDRMRIFLNGGLFIISLTFTSVIFITKPPISLMDKVPLVLMLIFNLFLVLVVVFFVWNKRFEVIDEKNEIAQKKDINSIIQDNKKWKRFNENLILERAIEDKEGKQFFVGLNNYSGIKTQLAVIVFLLTSEKIINEKKCKNQDVFLEILSIYYNLTKEGSLKKSMYGGVKKTFIDDKYYRNEQTIKASTHYYIYEKYHSFL